MKLVDILARELKVWHYPDDASVSQDNDKDIAFFEQSDQSLTTGYQSWSGNSYVRGSLTTLKELASDWKTAKVTRAEWQAAVDALNAPTVWGGEGLPPVGTVCEFDGFNPEETLTTDPRVGDQVTVIAHFKSGEFDLAAFTFHAPPEFNYLQVSQGAYGCFRPIRTPEQIEAEKRAGAVSEMVDNLKRYNSIHEACGMLYDAGYRKQ